ncbi:MAG TPA: glucose 1-dehydrogenase [Dehalococcoidia bacterium]|jgi:3-oxoacyl-[acyl-carrier protein] reductase|nr:glucose 1-dehydrogenase [Dehalococcoidia bacterium]
MDLKGKTAIVTGSAVGVGRATAIDLARRGANVVVNYSRSEDDAREAVRLVEEAGGQALLVKADVSRDELARDMVRQAVDAFGGLHVLVNNAATTHFVPMADLEGMKSEYWDDIYAVNVKGTFFCARAAAPAIRASGGGAIVNVASVAGVRAVGSSIAYAASKAAVINMTVALARVLGPEIRVNCVAPGFIDTRWLRNGLGEEVFAAAKAREERVAPLHAVCTPESVSQVILSLIEGADLVTGQTLVVDGGVGIAG